MSKSSRIGDLIHCFNFVASVRLTQSRAKGPVLALPSVLSVRNRVTLLSILLKCSCTEIFLWSRNTKDRLGSTLRAPLSYPVPGTDVSHQCDVCMAVQTRQYSYGKHRDSKALCGRLRSCNDVI